MHNLPGMKRYFEADKGAGAGAGVASTTKETFENPQTVKTEDVTAILHFDPFKKGDEIPPAKAAEKPAKADTEGASNVKKEGGESNLPAPSPAPAQATSTKPADAASTDDQAKHWREIAEARAEELKKVGKEAGADEGLKIPAYDFTIPDPLMVALGSEKPEEVKGAMVALCKGIAGAVHAQMLGHLEELYKPRFESIPAQVYQLLQTRERDEAVKKDFYGKYPELDHPGLKTLVRTTGESVAKKLGKTAWDTELRDAVAKEVKAILSVVSGQQTNGGDANPPARMLPSGGARAGVKTGDDLGRDIADTLFSQFDS